MGKLLLFKPVARKARNLAARPVDARRPGRGRAARMAPILFFVLPRAGAAVATHGVTAS